MGAAIAAIVFCKNVASEAVRNVGPEFLQIPNVWAAGLVLGGILPGLASPRLSCLKAASILTAALVLCYIVVAAWGLFHFGGPSIMPPLGEFNLDGMRTAFTLFLYPLLFHPNILPVFA